MADETERLARMLAEASGWTWAGTSVGLRESCRREAGWLLARGVTLAPAPAPAASPALEQEITSLLNRHSAENASNTPDFILARFLLGCLAAWNMGVQQRENWYGRDPRPSALRRDLGEPGGTQ
jgi:hypothetical protein